jgi:hypothetical protein
MKTRFSAIIALTVILLTASCGKKDMFVLQGTVPEGADTIVVVGIDSRFENVDTIFSRDGQFKWKFRPDTVTALILVLPDGRCHPVFAEKGVESFITIPSDSALFSVSGGYCNDSYQSFYLASQRDTSMEQTAARIDSFISRDPFSEVTPFLIYDQMVRKYHAPESAIEPLIKRMSGNMQDAPYLVSLKSEFSRDFATNSYLDNYSVTDSAGQKRSFIDIGGTANHLLVCVWASWMGNRGIQARDTLRYFLDKYQDRHLNVTDLSIDANPARWKEAIARDTVLWTSYNDPQAWESSIVKRATIRNAPVYVLFTGTKRLLFKSGSLAEIDSQLDKTLPKPRDDNKKK